MIELQCSECGQMNGVNFDELHRINNGASGDDTTAFTYDGEIKCCSCGAENSVEIDTDEITDTNEIVDYKFS